MDAVVEVSQQLKASGPSGADFARRFEWNSHLVAVFPTGKITAVPVGSVTKKLFSISYIREQLFTLDRSG